MVHLCVLTDLLLSLGEANFTPLRNAPSLRDLALSRTLLKKTLWHRGFQGQRQELKKLLAQALDRNCALRLFIARHELKGKGGLQELKKKLLLAKIAMET